jgi:hypothetical protein
VAKEGQVRRTESLRRDCTLFLSRKNAAGSNDRRGNREDVVIKHVGNDMSNVAELNDAMTMTNCGTIEN